MRTALLLLLLLSLLAATRADLPVHCLPEQIKGEWQFAITDDGKDRGVPKVCVYNSPLPFPVTKKCNVRLDYPNVAINTETGAKGTWTMIYDQGFEVIIEEKKYFAFFNFTKQGTKVISHCGETFTGWYHESTVNATNWGCFKGTKHADSENLVNEIDASEYFPAVNLDTTFHNDEKFIEKLNSAQNSWKAVAYPQFEGVPMAKMLKMLGKRIPAFRRRGYKKIVETMRQFQNTTNQPNDLPAQFDWKTSTKCAGGCVTPVRNQGMCGSCFAFSATGMFEARVMVQTSGKQKIIFSPQDDLNCDPYNQACNGGFTFSVSKYGQDYGIGTEECEPYAGHAKSCSYKCPESTRTYIKDYRYVGGYYGASTEQNMMEAIFNYGPISVDFQVYSDFYNYRSGVYHHVKLEDTNQDPRFEETNHAVLAVGWGVAADGQKYWIVKKLSLIHI